MVVVKFDVMEYIWKWGDYEFWGENILLQPKVINQVLDIGYDNRNAFIALSTISAVIYYYFFRFILSILFNFFLKIAQVKNDNALSFYKILSNGIFFSLIFKVMIEGIIEISIYSYFNLKSANFNSAGEILGIGQSYFSLALILIIMPLVNIYLLI